MHCNSLICNLLWIYSSELINDWSYRYVMSVSGLKSVNTYLAPPSSPPMFQNQHSLQEYKNVDENIIGKDLSSTNLNFFETRRGSHPLQKSQLAVSEVTHLETLKPNVQVTSLNQEKKGIKSYLQWHINWSPQGKRGWDFPTHKLCCSNCLCAHFYPAVHDTQPTGVHASFTESLATWITFCWLQGKSMHTGCYQAAAERGRVRCASVM